MDSVRAVIYFQVKKESDLNYHMDISIVASFKFYILDIITSNYEEEYDFTHTG